MAIKIPNEGATLDWGATASWQDAVVPVSGDQVVGEPGKSYTFTAGLNQSAVNLAALVMLDCYFKVDGQLQIDVNNSGRGVLMAPRGGSLRLSGATNVVSVERPGFECSIEGGAHALLNAVNGATIKGASAATFEEIAAFLSAYVKLESHASDRIKAKIGTSGKVITSRRVEEAYLADGLLELRDGARVFDGSSGGFVRMLSERSRLNLYGNAALTHTRVDCWAGTVDASQARGVQTISNDIETPMSRFIAESAGGTVVRSGTQKYGFNSSLTQRVALAVE